VRDSNRDQRRSPVESNRPNGRSGIVQPVARPSYSFVAANQPHRVEFTGFVIRFSHLAMRGAPAKAIQELAGHQDLVTTQRYMHLSPG